MKRSNTWRDVDDFDFGNEDVEDELRMVDAYAATSKSNRGHKQQKQQGGNSIDTILARTGRFEIQVRSNQDRGQFLVLYLVRRTSF